MSCSKISRTEYSLNPLVWYSRFSGIWISPPLPSRLLSLAGKIRPWAGPHLCLCSSCSSNKNILFHCSQSKSNPRFKSSAYTTPPGGFPASEPLLFIPLVYQWPTSYIPIHVCLYLLYYTLMTWGEFLWSSQKGIQRGHRGKSLSQETAKLCLQNRRGEREPRRERDFGEQTCSRGNWSHLMWACVVSLTTIPPSL